MLCFELYINNNILRYHIIFFALAFIAKMALSNIQQVDNILNALTTSEEAAKKDLKELALPSYEILANSDLANHR